MINSKKNKENKTLKINKMISFNDKTFYFINKNMIEDRNKSENKLFSKVSYCDNIEINKVKNFLSKIKFFLKFRRMKMTRTSE